MSAFNGVPVQLHLNVDTFSAQGMEQGNKQPTHPERVTVHLLEVYKEGAAEQSAHKQNTQTIGVVAA